MNTYRLSQDGELLLIIIDNIVAVKLQAAVKDAPPGPRLWRPREYLVLMNKDDSLQTKYSVVVSDPDDSMKREAAAARNEFARKLPEIGAVLS